MTPKKSLAHLPNSVSLFLSSLELVWQSNLIQRLFNFTILSFYIVAITSGGMF
uniref:Transmembrane protein n=1 Tax=Medicago truncatula TaxID=3880 RepID=I3SR16_MEDTR|nr:unknown [Medicago truncatula]